MGGGGGHPAPMLFLCKWAVALQIMTQIMRFEQNFVKTVTLPNFQEMKLCSEKNTREKFPEN
jgi:hypothetical protein